MLEAGRDEGTVRLVAASKAVSIDRIREAIKLCLEVEGAPEQDLEFVGIQRVTIAA